MGFWEAEKVRRGLLFLLCRCLEFCWGRIVVSYYHVFKRLVLIFEQGICDL